MHATRILATFVAFGLSTLALAGHGGQPAAQQPPRFRTGIDVIQLDVADHRRDGGRRIDSPRCAVREDIIEMKIYFAFTVRGNRGALAAAREVSAMLQQHGHDVLTTHLLLDDPDGAESALTDGEVYARDIGWLESADLLIAEASGSSYGVGFEVGYVLARSEQTGQRVLLLYDEARRPAISRFIAGANHPACTVRGYRQPADLLAIVQEYLSA